MLVEQPTVSAYPADLWRKSRANDYERFLFHVGSGKQPAVIDSVIQVRVAFTNLPGRRTDDNRERRNIFAYDGACADDRPPSNGDARKDKGSRPNKNIVVDHYRQIASGKLRIVRVVLGGKNAGLGRNGHIFADRKAASIIKTATLINGTALSEMKISPRIEARATENATAPVDIKPHDVTIKGEPHGVTWNIGNNAIANEEQPIEPNAAEKNRRFHCISGLFAG
jgi:hypothetical protein